MPAGAGNTPDPSPTKIYEVILFNSRVHVNTDPGLYSCFVYVNCDFGHLLYDEKQG